MGIKTRYTVSNTAYHDPLNLLFAIVNSNLAAHFDGKAYMCVEDYTGNKHDKFLDEWFPDKEANVRVYRRADLPDMRDAAIRLIERGDAVLMTDYTNVTKYVNVPAAEQARLAEENDDLGITLVRQPRTVVIDDPLRGPITVKLGEECIPPAMFYNGGNVNPAWANAYDDGVLEVSHVVRHINETSVTATEILFHELMETSPPMYMHMEIASYKLNGMEPYRLAGETMEIVRRHVWECVAGKEKPERPWKFGDMSFLRVPEKITYDDIENKVASAFLAEANEERQLSLLRYFCSSGGQDRMRPFLKLITGKGWDGPTIRSFLSAVVTGPSLTVETIGVRSKYSEVEIERMPGYAEYLNRLKWTKDVLVSATLDFSARTRIPSNKLEEFLHFSILGKIHPPVSIYEVMEAMDREMGKKKLQTAVKMLLGPEKMKMFNTNGWDGFSIR